ncbi:MAG TPA: hypothetical protein VH044_19155 [Polyangiaceae bacterium]|jgi:hypothetical protein|nr:hypothetical protein [Polyangiaceae bacterium]
MGLFANVAAATCVATVLLAHPARADDLDLPPPPVRWGDRMLADHTFLFPALYAGAFIPTYFGVTQGVYEEHIPSVPLPFGNSGNLDLIGYVAAVNLGVKIVDWFGVQATGTGLAVVGTGGESVIYSGGNLNVGGSIAPIVRIARIESTGTQVSARGQIGWLKGAALDVPRFLLLGQSAIASANDPADAAGAIGRGIIGGGLTRVIIEGVDTFGLNGEVAAAQAFGPMFGLQAALTFQRRLTGVNLRQPVSGSFRESDTRYDLLADVSFEWDGDSLHVPVAAIVEYEANARLGGTGDEGLEQDGLGVHTIGGGVYYSGRKDLQVGIFGATKRNLRAIPGVADAPGQSGTPSVQIGEFVMRYIW